MKKVRKINKILITQLKYYKMNLNNLDKTMLMVYKM